MAEPPVLLRGERVTVRSMTADDVEPVAQFVVKPGTREWWPEAGEPDRLREGLGPDHDTFVIEVDGRVVGWMAKTEERDPDWMNAAIDISLDPDYTERGLGPEALRLLIDWLMAERGHHRFTIDPAATNERAIRAYSKVGFRPIGIARQAERLPGGGWRDGLLMDLLAEELR
jgi:aminoglycoside 6'-N-acetyltransferase